jgi:hypothetical protein
MMLATVTGSMLVKRIAVRTVQRFGYKRVLQVNSVMLALMLASFGLVVPGTPVWLLLVQLFIFGGFNSMQFSAMNSVTLKDMEGESASSGNSLLSMVQMLAMSMGVAWPEPADGLQRYVAGAQRRAHAGHSRHLCDGGSDDAGGDAGVQPARCRRARAPGSGWWRRLKI